MNVSERFLNYVKYGTQSDITSSTVPSTKGQLVLAARLADELKALGITDAHTDENGYVYGHIPAAKGCTGAQSQSGQSGRRFADVAFFHLVFLS